MNGSGEPSRLEARQEKTVLFVCTANVCRSPMAEAIFDALAEEEGLAYKACSAGVAALVGEGIDPKAGRALAELGLTAKGHRARQVSEEIVDEADLVLAMTPEHANTLRQISGPAKVHTLLEYATGAPDSQGVPDPHGHSMASYRSSLRQLQYHLELVVRKLTDGT